MTSECLLVAAACALDLTVCTHDASALRDAGVFSYGFVAESKSTPFAFYMKGVPWIANWMWQSFANFREELPPAEVWEVPAACEKAVACPGW